MTSPAPDAPSGLIGQSAAMRHVRALIEKIGPSRSAVLILGESGTGKEVVARALHLASAQGAFVPIDCGSLVGPLMESELFGHTRGAFTGANETKKGLIELAHKGTAFFDEIGDLPLELQVKLLRLLQEREYRPVGSLARFKVELRVIAATHRNLSAEVERKAFRQDLFYRLNVITIRLAPLRDRKEDIPLLVEDFLSKKAQRFTLTQEVMESLMLHDWPGNVRELNNCLDRMTAVNAGPLLHLSDMPSAVQLTREAARAGVQHSAVATQGRAVATGLPAITAGQVTPLAELERQAILNALEATKGDRGVAALLLGIGRTTLYRKLKSFQ
jgi:DNA-binding NtrC family response regulator